MIISLRLTIGAKVEIAVDRECLSQNLLNEWQLVCCIFLCTADP